MESGQLLCTRRNSTRKFRTYNARCCYTNSFLPVIDMIQFMKHLLSLFLTIKHRYVLTFDEKKNKQKITHRRNLLKKKPKCLPCNVLIFSRETSLIQINFRVDSDAES